jgi:RNase P/RNase MRP subunit POP5
LSFEEPVGEGEVFALEETFGELLAVLGEPPQADADANMTVTKKAMERRTGVVMVRRV